MDLASLSISKVKAALRAGEFSVVDLVGAYRQQIEKHNGRLNAYLEVFDDALDQAATIDQQIKSGEELPALAGVPLAVKDNILIAGKIASGASKILSNYRAAYDATAIAKLKAAGAIFLGRTNLDEFAMGSSTENSAFGPSKNPHDETRVPGGSSGGSAAALAADMSLAALGSDTGGSIRQPASFCGVVGLKPSYGAVSRHGLYALASSLDQIGPLSKTVADAELIFNVIKGTDANDATSYYPEPEAKVEVEKTLTLGVPEHLLEQGVAPAVAENFKQSLAKLKQLGHEIKTIELPNARYALACYYIILPAEASANLARYDGLRYGVYKGGDNLLEDYRETRGAGFGPETRRRILLGTYVLSAGYYDAYYRQAIAVKQLVKSDFRAAFAQVDAIVMPTAPTTAFKLGERTADPLAMYAADIFTIPANLAGIPAISVPSGTDPAGLPCGLQIMAPLYQEARLFALGKQFYDPVS